MSSESIRQPEKGVPRDFAPDFSKGLIPAIAQDQATGEVLMLAYMNEDAWRKTLESGEAHYWSRSRRELWRKGGTSGHVQKVRGLPQRAALLLLPGMAGWGCDRLFPPGL